MYFYAPGITFNQRLGDSIFDTTTWLHALQFQKNICGDASVLGCTSETYDGSIANYLKDVISNGWRWVILTNRRFHVLRLGNRSITLSFVVGNRHDIASYRNPYVYPLLFVVYVKDPELQVTYV